MKKKQWIAFACAMALGVTSLAGCGKSEENTTEKGSRGGRRNSKRRSPAVKISGNRNGSSGRFNEFKCQDS